MIRRLVKLVPRVPMRRFAQPSFCLESRPGRWGEMRNGSGAIARAAKRGPIVFVSLAENQLASCRNASAGFLDGISNIDNRGYCRSKQAVQFAAGTLVFETRSKRLHGVFVAISVELFVLDKIPKVLAIVVNQQCFSRRPFRKDNFVGFQLDMEIVDGLTIIHFGQRDCSSIHKPFDRNEKAVDEEAVVRRKEQVTTRVFIAEREFRDTDRCNTPVPG